MLLTAQRADGLRVDTLKDNIEMDIKEMAFITSGTFLICSIYNLKITATILV
jgi:hypothetical protein